MQLAYDTLAATPVATDPFPHVIVPRLRPAGRARRRASRDLPPIGRRGSFPIGSLRLGPAARALMQALDGPALRAAIADKFGLDLRRRRHHADPARPLRRARRPHPLRLPPPSGSPSCCTSTATPTPGAASEGCLRLLRGPDDIENYAVEVPPVNGTLLVFPNGPTTWHGHQPFVGQRTVVQLNYMTNNAAARSELRRHRVSAFVKRLTAAA